MNTASNKPLGRFEVMDVNGRRFSLHRILNSIMEYNNLEVLDDLNEESIQKVYDAIAEEASEAEGSILPFGFGANNKVSLNSTIRKAYYNLSKYLSNRSIREANNRNSNINQQLIQPVLQVNPVGTNTSAVDNNSGTTQGTAGTTVMNVNSSNAATEPNKSRVVQNNTSATTNAKRTIRKSVQGVPNSDASKLRSIPTYERSQELLGGYNINRSLYGQPFKLDGKQNSGLSNIINPYRLLNDDKLSIKAPPLFQEGPTAAEKYIRLPGSESSMPDYSSVLKVPKIRTPFTEVASIEDMRKTLAPAMSLNVPKYKIINGQIIGVDPASESKSSAQGNSTNGNATPPTTPPKGFINGVGGVINSLGKAMPTLGDMMAGYGVFKGMNDAKRLTLEERATDVPNENPYLKFGQQGLQELSKQEDLINRGADRQSMMLRNNEVSLNDSIRNSTRGMNTQRALMQANNANTFNQQLSIDQNRDNAYQNLLGQRASMLNQIDQMAMQGEAQKDLANRQDRGAFYSNLSKNEMDIATGLQHLGGMLNKNKLNMVNANLIRQLSQYGFEIDKDGNLKKSK